MSDRKLLLMIDSEPLRQARIEEMLKTSEKIELRSLMPAEVEQKLKTIKHDQIAAIIMDQGVFVDRLFCGGIELIQRLRSIPRLHCSIILISSDNEPSDSIMDYSGHFFLPRYFQEAQFISTLEEAMNTRLSERELQEMIDEYCLPQLISAFRRESMGHGISNLRGSVRFALNGKQEKTEYRLNNCLGYLRDLRQRASFTNLTVTLDSRFEKQSAEIDSIFDQMHGSLEDALNAVKRNVSSELQRIKSEFSEKSDVNPFVNAVNRLEAILLEIEEKLN